MKLGAALLFSALSLSAQTAYEIRGVVREPTLGVIAGAEVRLTNVSAAGIKPTEFSASTDARGQFLIRPSSPGNYLITARMSGYGLPVEGVVTSIDGDHPQADVEVRMVRLGQVRGRVLNAETRQPVEGADVVVVSKRFDDRGNVAWTPAFSQIGRDLTPLDRETLARQTVDERKTKQDGSFAMSNLMPGEFAATLTPQQPSPWSLGFSADDLKSFDQEIELLYWPGGVSSQAVRAVTLAPGGVAYIGDILLEKKRHYRAHVSLAQGSCPAGESMRLTLYRRDSTSAPPEVAPCGSELLLRRLVPGSYVIYGVSDWQAYRDSIDNAAWATAEFEVSDKNVEVNVVPQSGVLLDVRLITAEGVTGLPDQATLVARPEPLVPGVVIPPEDFSEKLPDGRIRVAVSPRPFDATLYVNPPFYLKQLRYNGAPLTGTRVPISPGSPVQQLEVVVDNRLGVLTGSVPNASQPSLLVLWMEDITRPTLVPFENGSFRKDNMVPGEYRAAIAVRSELGGINLTELAKTGKRFVIRAGEVTTLDLR